MIDTFQMIINVRRDNVSEYACERCGKKGSMQPVQLTYQSDGTWKATSFVDPLGWGCLYTQGKPGPRYFCPDHVAELGLFKSPEW